MRAPDGDQYGMQQAWQAWHHVSDAAIIQNDSVAEYTEQTFKMYGGEAADCALELDNSLIGVIHDKFGEDVQMIRMNENTLIATVKVQISPTFWGWLFQFAGKMKILSPGNLVEEYKALAAKIMN